MQKILKNEKGSISLFVLLSALFFLAVVTSVSISFKNKERSIDSQFEKIKSGYEKDVGNESAVYNGSVTKTVTFDANGGNVTTQSKVVKIGETYGDLPTPTRDGYTFKGWNGKNKLDIDNFMNIYTPYQNTPPEKVNFQGEEVWRMYGQMNTEGRAIHYMNGIFKNDIQYTISVDIYDVYSYSPGAGVLMAGISPRMIYTDETSKYIFRRNSELQETWQRLEFISDIDKDIDYIEYAYGTGNAYSYIKKFQIEQGSTATEYEPYFVTSSTKVTQNNDNKYVLTAIWEPNE